MFGDLEGALEGEGVDGLRDEGGEALAQHGAREGEQRGGHHLHHEARYGGDMREIWGYMGRYGEIGAPASRAASRPR